MKRLALAVVMLVALTTPIQAQTPDDGKLERTDCSIEWATEEIKWAAEKKIRKIQVRLQILGYDIGPVDGALCPKTIEAIRAFVTEEGLTDDYESSDNKGSIFDRLEMFRPKGAGSDIEGLGLIVIEFMLDAAIPSFTEGLTALERGQLGEALRVFKIRAALGSAAAQYNLGNMYAGGKGGPQDYVEAVKWYRLAAEQGDAVAQLTLGRMYVGGKGVPQDYVEAAQWYYKAAKRGYAEAQMALGNMHYRCGREIRPICASATPVYPDYTEAAKWFRKAAEQGNVDAKLYLGRMYANGEGVPQDYLLAHMWLNLAAAHRSSFAKERDAQAAKMTAAQIAEAQKLAREWMENHGQ